MPSPIFLNDPLEVSLVKLLEYQGKALFSGHGIVVPRGKVAKTPEEAERVFEELRVPVVVKAQVTTGGRGKAGGVKLASSSKEVKEAASAILGMKIKGNVVRSLLVEEALDLDKEMYLSFTVDSSNSNVLFMFSPEGGMDIEELAREKPDRLLRWHIEDVGSTKEYELRNRIRKLGLRGKELVELSSLAFRACQCFYNNDLLLLEINPLCRLKDGRFVAADAKVEVDDNALFRHEELEAVEEVIEDPFEREAREIGVTYVNVGGNVGVIASGAGLAMNTMDILFDEGLKPANFLETGGGITQELIFRSLKLLFKDDNVKGIIVNLYGGVNPMVEAAKGVVEGVKVNAKAIPIVVKLLGNQQEEAWAILEAAGVPVVKSVHTEEAVLKLKEAMGVNL